MFYIVRTDAYSYEGSMTWEWFFEDKTLAEAFAENIRKVVPVNDYGDPAEVWIQEASFQTRTELTEKEVMYLGA